MEIKPMQPHLCFGYERSWQLFKEISKMCDSPTFLTLTFQMTSSFFGLIIIWSEIIRIGLYICETFLSRVNIHTWQCSAGRQTYQPRQNQETWLVKSRDVVSSRRSLRWMSSTKATYLPQPLSISSTYSITSIRISAVPGKQDK